MDVYQEIDGVRSIVPQDTVKIWDRDDAGLPRTATDAEVATAQAAIAKRKAAGDLKNDAIARLAAYRYQGVSFPLSRELVAYYKGIADTAPKIPVAFFPFEMIGDDGTLTAANTDDVLALFNDMQNTYMSIMKSLGNSLKELNQ